MNLEIANRLVALRKGNHLSQEALAEKLGISRQAVSKWERAEASPDTDNLIALAKLYHVSLDELLRIHEEDEEEYVRTDMAADAACPKDQISGQIVSVSGSESGSGSNGPGVENTASDHVETGGETEEQTRQEDGDDIQIGLHGIHVKEQDGDEVHIGWNGIHVRDQDNEVHIDRHGIYVNGEPASSHLFTRGRERAEFPLGIIAIVLYIVLGACFDLWHPGWLIFLLVPVIGSLIQAVRERNARLFAYPVLVLFFYLYVGWVYSVWYPTWVLFLTIPVYYSIVNYIRDRRQ